MDKFTYIDLLECLRAVASKHSIDIFDVLKCIDDTSEYRGIRSIFGALASKRDIYQPTERERDRVPSGEMSVLLTGIRSGEYIIGIGKQSKDTILKFRMNSVIRPSREELDYIRKKPEEWKRFIRKLSNIEYFAGLTEIEREVYLEEYQDNYEDNYFEDFDDVYVQFLQIGSSSNNAFLGLDEKHIEELGQDKFFSSKYVVGMFKGKPGSKGIGGSRHTLIFRRGNWKISTIYKEVNNFDGVTLSIGKGIMLAFDTFAKKYSQKGVEETQTIAIEFPKNSSLVESQIYQLILDIFDKYILEDIRRIKKECFFFTAASYKSLLQKIIRFRSVNIRLHDGSNYESEFVACCAFGMLMLHPGSFVSDIQRFVTGLESAFKRLGVISFEDGYFEDEEFVKTLFISAYLAQRVPGWKPSRELIASSLHHIISLIRSQKAFNFNVHDGSLIQKYTITASSRPLEVVASLIEEIRSFAGDINMIKYITSSRYTGKLTTTASPERPEYMLWEHCVDQHWAPEIVYFYSEDTVRDMAVKSSQPYSKLLGDLFNKITGVNPRRLQVRTKKTIYDSDVFDNDPFIRETRHAQYLTLLSKGVSPTAPFPAYRPISFMPTGDSITIDYDLEDGMIAGLVGSVEIKGSPIALVSLHPDDPKIINAIVRPSRNMKTSILSPDREDSVIRSFRKRLLEDGIPLSQTKSPLEVMRGSMLFLDAEGEYTIRLRNTTKVAWNDLRKGQLTFQEMNPVNLDDIELLLRISGEGIVMGADDRLLHLLQTTRKESIQRAITYISTKSLTFEIRRVGRDGGGTQGAVNVNDVGAYHFILKVCALYPSAIQRAQQSPYRFQIRNGPLMWKISSFIAEFVARLREEHIDIDRWNDLGSIEQRSLWPHQEDTIRRMQTSHTSGKKGIFLNMPVGQGKTLCVLSYLKWLKDNAQLPKYVIYTLPESAITSVVSELSEKFGGLYKLIIPTQTKLKNSSRHVVRSCRPEPYHINFIEHDHLRRCEELFEYASESIFIVDEVHKALNDTKRTDTALQISHLSKEFVVLTGTPIIDTHTYKLIWWLSQISPFEVNESNFFVSASNMISKKVTLPSNIIEKDIEVDTYPEYFALVPPALGGTNTHPKHSDFEKAFEMSYKSATIGIIDRIIHYLERNITLLSNGVFVVARNLSHQSQIQSLLIERGVRSSDIFLIGKNKTLNFTDETVRLGMVPDYKVVITTMNYSDGYNLTRLNVMIRSVYPSNQATREQLDGRINRIGQSSKELYYEVIHSGILTHILRRHNDAKNLSDVLKKLADDII